MTSNNQQIAHHWIAAFNAHDLDRLLSLYAEDAEHHSPKLQLRQPETFGKIRGKNALKDWWADAFLRLPTLRYDLQNLITDDRQVLMEYKRSVAGEKDMMVAEILEIQHGLIIRSRVYHG